MRYRRQIMTGDGRTRRRKKAAGGHLLRRADLLTGGQEQPATSVWIAGGRVRAVGKTAERLGRRAGASPIDLDDHFLSPGFVDLHTHGAVGVDFVEARESDLEALRNHYLSCGVTSVLMSLYAGTPKNTLETVTRAARNLAAPAAGGLFAGLHMEGPYLSLVRPGALPKQHFRTYRDPGELDALITASGGTLRTMTLAPERPGNDRLIAALKRRGIVPCFGHSDADYAQARRALQRGMGCVTHFFNAMRGLHHRSPGPIAAVFEDAAVAAELIVDGHHVDYAALRLVLRSVGPLRTILVSDSVAACGLPEGKYQFAGRTVAVKEGKVTLPDGTLAGSLSTLDAAVRLAVRHLELSPAGATQLVTRNPARLIGLRTRGEIRAGRTADLVLLDRKLRVRATWLRGELAWSRKGALQAGW